VDGFPVIGKVNDISSILKTHVIDEVFLAVPRKMIEDVEDIVYACEQEGVKLRMMADMFDVKVARMQLVKLGGIPLLTLEPVAQDEWKLIAKRIMDLIFALVSLAFFLPLMGIAAIAVKLDSPGPIFFAQERIGLKKRRFVMIKFRSMVVNAEKRMNEIEHLNEAEGPIFKISNDPRVTWVGKILRQTSLDELPQLFNVIKGDMSLVGPRPMSIRDVDLFDKGIQRKRFSVKPGLTCIWQISGRSNLPFSKWLEHDLKYIESWSLSLDIKILFKTIPAVVKGSGAV
jgi:exopolysaccharide biosynthesis polyprenyl glycosylphosphotransferase